ncbi:MAG: hypothetical protein N5P05_001846 [Chroococcopsis gigantea SAG 12.99]|jgi:hypothetical protein|nr:DUF4350 domain-containing protein [Chlorogloea purpurea SAG 13.99]MDV3000240.1 hypothetical protein [Chroococcopsis gigantea SAG 12.99]
MRKFNRRNLSIGSVIAVAIMLLITIMGAPGSGVDRGSTYGRSPGGYGAWYSYMLKRSTPVERWRKSFSTLAKQEGLTTLVRVYPELTGETIDTEVMQWVERGNNLVILGVREPVSAAEFTSIIPHETGAIKIDTTRRQTSSTVTTLLEDKYGAIVWRTPVGEGSIVRAVTPYLGANAYQDSPGNYEFLTMVVRKFNQPILIDEYLHGYKDKETVTKEVGDNIWTYLVRTPWLIFFVQSVFVLAIFIFAHNHRLGKPAILKSPETNNSEAYIIALSQVLHKAQQSQFVMGKINQSEQLALQKKLNLGETLLPISELLEALLAEGKFVSELESLLKIQTPHLDDRALSGWLEKWRQMKLKL